MFRYAKYALLHLCLLLIITASLSTVSMYLNQSPVYAALSASDFNYEFNVSGGQLRIRAYINQGRGCTGDRAPRGPAAIEWITIDGSNYGASNIDTICLRENGRLYSDYNQQPNSTAQLFSIRVTSSNGSGKRLAKKIGNGDWWREADIQVGKPERREAWLSCIADGRGASQECVEERLRDVDESDSGNGNSGGGGGGDGSREEEGQELDPTCESEGTSNFEWALCPVLDLILDGLEIFANAVENRLRIGIDDESSFRAAWNGLRIIGNIIFIMAFLAIIISQTIVGRF